MGRGNETLANRTARDSSIPRCGGTGAREVCQTAFSLVEVMMAAAVLGVLIFAVLAGTSYGFTAMRLSRENQRATQVLLEKLEQFRLFNWEQITTNGLPTNFVAPYYPITNLSNAGFTYTGSVSILPAPFSEPYADSLRLVTIQVSWPSGNLLRQRSVSTLVASNGLFNYIF